MFYRRCQRLSRSDATDSIESQTLPRTPSRRKNHRDKNTELSCGDLSKQSAYQIICDDYGKNPRNNCDGAPLRGCFNSNSLFDRLTNTTCYTLQTTTSIPLPKLKRDETEFLNLIAEDDIQAAEEYVTNTPQLNINCVNYQGISALHVAVRNKSEAMVEFLLKQPNIEIGDTILHAVRDNCNKILETLLEAQKKICPGLEFAGAANSFDFPQYLTPLILASQLRHYETVRLLVARGHVIIPPHPPKCACVKCIKTFTSEDPLYTSSCRLAMYQALASPAYIIHVSSDPILHAITLTKELAANESAYRHLDAGYKKLRYGVSSFAVDLIGCCRTSEEVELILKQNSGCERRRQFTLPRLLMASDYMQKGFVAHPNTQQVLESHWLGDWYGWRRKSYIAKAWTILSRVLVTPVILVMCMIAPRCSLVKHWQIPLNKLITHAAAYSVFLCLVFHISNQDKARQKRGPPNTGAEGVLILYVCGYSWSALRMCLMQGPQRFFREMWNWCEIIMLALFWVTFLFWVQAALQLSTSGNLERKYWDKHDPTLLAEGTFCLATIFAFFRLMFLCQLNYHLGPLQVSLGKMTIDIYKYIIVFAIIISAFAAGLARFYQYYNGMVYEDGFGMKTVQVSSFTNLADTLNTLFWALFCMAPLESADVVLENRKGTQNRLSETKHSYTEKIGYLCFGCFEVISVIVVLNMLIATMSHTFQRVTDNVAVEWTYAKTEVYIYYMLQTTVPSPYNMIPTASAMGDVIDWIRYTISPTTAKGRCSFSYCCYIERDVEADIEKDFPVLMSVLIQRYFRREQSKKGSPIDRDLETLKREVICTKKLIEKQNST